MESDQLASQKPADLDPPCFQNSGIFSLSGFNMVNVEYNIIQY